MKNYIKHSYLLISIVISITACSQSNLVSSKSINATSIQQNHATTASSDATLPGLSQATATRTKSSKEITDQSFWVTFKSWGKVRFISAVQTDGNGYQSLLLSLQNKNGDTIYTFPKPKLTTSWRFRTVKAVSFKDVDDDGEKDVIIIADYASRHKTEIMTSIFPLIFIQKDKSFFSDDHLDEQLLASGNIKAVGDVIAFISEQMASSIKSQYEIVNQTLCEKVLNLNMTEDKIYQTYYNEYEKQKFDLSEAGEDRMAGNIGECFNTATNKLLKNHKDLKMHTDSIRKTIYQIISDIADINYTSNGGGTMWGHNAARTTGIYGYRFNVYVKMKLNHSALPVQNYESVSQRLDNDLKGFKTQSLDFSESWMSAQQLNEAKKQLNSDFTDLKNNFNQLKHLTSDRDSASEYILQQIVDDIKNEI